MGLVLELYTLIVLQAIIFSMLKVFMVETEWWKMFVSIIGFNTATVLLYYVVGHWSLIIPIGMFILMFVGHTIFCHKEKIGFFSGTPRRKLYQIKRWKWFE